MIPLGAYVSVNWLPRRVATDADIDRLLNAGSVIVWTNIGALMCFSILLSSAILARRRVELHKRLMLIASISMISPAITRITGWPVFANVDNVDLLRFGLMSLLFVPLFVHDFATNRRVHPVTVAGTAGVLGVKAIFGYLISSTAAGLAFVRGFTL
jgi:hypothetical protein